MTTVLGIDPAWTPHNPSGVAALVKQGPRWTCAGLAPSYGQFIALSHGVAVDWAHPVAGTPDPSQLLRAAQRLAGVAVGVVAIDMPISTSPITARREADSKASKAFARAKCATHSPTRERPGKLSDRLSRDFASAGYDIATVGMGGSSGRLFETYPHPALLSLMNGQERLKYKLSRTQKYWPDTPPAERRIRLVREWSRILERLGEVIGGINLAIPSDDSVGSISLKELKGVEDALDALVCAWVATEFLADNCDAYGDDTAAIWIPRQPRSWKAL